MVVLLVVLLLVSVLGRGMVSVSVSVLGRGMVSVLRMCRRLLVERRWWI